LPLFINVLQKEPQRNPRTLHDEKQNPNTTTSNSTRSQPETTASSYMFFRIANKETFDTLPITVEFDLPERKRIEHRISENRINPIFGYEYDFSSIHADFHGKTGTHSSL